MLYQQFDRVEHELHLPINRSVRLNKVSTSLQLEAVYWDLLENLAENSGARLSALLGIWHDEYLENSLKKVSFASFVRVKCLQSRILTINEAVK